MSSSPSRSAAEPLAAEPLAAEPLVPAPGETLDLIAGDWRIFQLENGHRFSTDDLVTAWVGATAAPDATRLLDIGAGIGSVGLMALWMVSHRWQDDDPVPRPDATPTLDMVEAQALSHGLARRSVAFNGLADRVVLRLGDLRDQAMVPEPGVYDLVTGSPPYIPIGKGHVSPHPQRAACRMELRGDVFDYCLTAARALAPEGRFSMVHAAADPRPEAALEAAGLQLLERTDVVFRRGRAPTIAVFLAAHQGLRRPDRQLVVREADGQWTDDWRAVRRSMGAPIGPGW